MDFPAGFLFHFLYAIKVRSAQVFDLEDLGGRLQKGLDLGFSGAAVVGLFADQDVGFGCGFEGVEDGMPQVFEAGVEQEATAGFQGIGGNQALVFFEVGGIADDQIIQILELGVFQFFVIQFEPLALQSEFGRALLIEYKVGVVVGLDFEKGDVFDFAAKKSEFKTDDSAAGAQIENASVCGQRRLRQIAGDCFGQQNGIQRKAIAFRLTVVTGKTGAVPTRHGWDVA